MRLSFAYRASTGKLYQGKADAHRGAVEHTQKVCSEGELGGFNVKVKANPGALTFRISLPHQLCYAKHIAMNSRGLDQAYRMQDFAFDAAMALRDAMSSEGKVRAPSKEDSAALGVVGKVWKDAQEQIRIHKGKPLPGSLTHEKVKQSRTRASLSALSALASLADDTAPNDIDTAPNHSSEAANDEPRDAS
jgi:hypothetical protein